ncbi:MAG: hypothetical protein J4G17_02070 [Anaerolineae bacterium]|nr:hypothetical protein [Anaerolineae bacterium]
MLLFRSEGDLDAWCQQEGRPRGAVLTLQHTWALAQAWYRNRLSPTFQGRSPAEAQELFASLGLRGPFWEVP